MANWEAVLPAAAAPVAGKRKRGTKGATMTKLPVKSKPKVVGVTKPAAVKKAKAKLEKQPKRPKTPPAPKRARARSFDDGVDCTIRIERAYLADVKKTLSQLRRAARKASGEQHQQPQSRPAELAAPAVPVAATGSASSSGGALSY